MSFYSDEYVAGLLVSPLAGAIDACSRALQHVQMDELDVERPIGLDVEVLVEAVALVSQMESAGLISYQLATPDVRGDAKSDFITLSQFLESVRKDLTEQVAVVRYAQLSARFKVQLGAAFSYEFSKGDQERIQELINELRDFVSSTDHFESEHKQRLLRRLESLQAEVHKRVADLDRFWGMVGDAGVAMGKFGKDAKPFVDRIRELTGIIWRTQARAEELPSDAQPPLLPGPEEDA